MTKGESAWRKVKIEGSQEKFPSGVFRRCNLANEKKGPILQLEERSSSHFFNKTRRGAESPSSDNERSRKPLE